MGSTADANSGEDTDFSDSETEEYASKVYEELKSGKHQFKISGDAYTCPFCPKKRKRDFHFKELLQHANGVGSCTTSKKRSPKDIANHRALAKYLESEEVNLTVEPSPSTKTKPSQEAKTIAEHDPDETFVWPWIGIVVNIPTEIKDGRSVGGSGSKLRDEFTNMGFNPTRVKPLWNYNGHSGMALVEFLKDWTGFTNAMNFEKFYVANHHGRKNWVEQNVKKIGLYGWVARVDDYNLDNIVGENLRKIGDLKTISDIMEEEARKTNKLVGSLENVIEAKKLHLLEMQYKFTETETSLQQAMRERDDLHHSYYKEIQKIEASCRDYSQKILDDHAKVKLQLETQKRDLELRTQELMKREAHNEVERKKMAEDLQQTAVENCHILAAAEEQRKVDENLMKLAEEQKKELEELNRRSIKLQTQLEQKQAVQLEIEKLRGELNVMKHLRNEDEDMEVLEKVESVYKALREKETEYADIEALNQNLVVAERKINDELQEARKEMINCLKEMTADPQIGVKRMGELDTKPFHEAMKRKYSEAEADEKATELCSLWEEYLRDSSWHPIKVATIDGEPQSVIDEDDERLRDLKENYGEKVYKAVTDALYEINECNPSGGYVISEMWNYDEGRKASLSEGVEILLKQWKFQRRKKGMDRSID